MTHRLPSSLLEDFLDDELPQEQTETVRRHLEQSPELKRDYTVAVRLKSLMRRMPPPDPGESLGQMQGVDSRIRMVRRNPPNCVRLCQDIPARDQTTVAVAHAEGPLYR